jgi:hypothetical protein
MGRVLFLAVLAALAGCSSPGDTSTNGMRGTPIGAQPRMDATGGTGGSIPMTTGDFGNSTAPPPPPVEQTGQAGGGCIVGQFCAPTAPDPEDCGSLTLEAEVETIEHPGNVLLVFDRSGSMSERWSGQTRWEAAGSAIESALTPIASKVTIGSVFFPSADPNAPARCVDPTGIACLFVPTLVVPGGTCGVNPITAMDQLNFAPGPEFLSRFRAANNRAPIYAPVPGGFTPIKEALQVAQTALSSASLEGNTSVVLITDGDPNCEWDAAVARQIVTDWRANGIDTYVVGLPGLSGMGERILNELAAAGGTGMYIPPTNAMELEQRLRQIATETVRSGFDSCEITLNPPADVPDKLHLIVKEGGMELDVARDLAADFSWNITDDGSQVSLQGRLCDDATNGRFESLRFVFGCVEVPPLEPPPPVE